MQNFSFPTTIVPVILIHLEKEKTMFNLPGGWELLIIIVVVVVLFGGNKAMDRVKDLGKNVYKAKKEIDDLKDITK